MRPAAAERPNFSQFYRPARCGKWSDCMWRRVWILKCYCFLPPGSHTITRSNYYYRILSRTLVNFFIATDFSIKSNKISFAYTCNVGFWLLLLLLNVEQQQQKHAVGVAENNYTSKVKFGRNIFASNLPTFFHGFSRAASAWSRHKQRINRSTQAPAPVCRQ